MFRLKMILRLLQISSFNGKMNALNEINKVIASVASYPHRTTGNSVVTGANETDEEWLTAERYNISKIYLNSFLYWNYI
jgi:ubiquitin carboxyl-terminal hydrolase 9/24